MSGHNKLFISILLILLVACILLLSDRNGYRSAVASPSPYPQSSTDVSTQIQDVQWLWKETLMSDGSKTGTDPNNSFSITFLKDMTVSVTTDCNNGSGKYTLGADNSITIGPIATTMMFCEGSNESAFYNHLSQVDSYLYADSQLFLLLKVDSGTMEFAR